LPCGLAIDLACEVIGDTIRNSKNITHQVLSPMSVAALAMVPKFIIGAATL
jgi:hypothetical protein